MFHSNLLLHDFRCFSKFVKCIGSISWLNFLFDPRMWNLSCPVAHHGDFHNSIRHFLPFLLLIQGFRLGLHLFDQMSFVYFLRIKLSIRFGISLWILVDSPDILFTNFLMKLMANHIFVNLWKLLEVSLIDLWTRWRIYWFELEVYFSLQKARIISG